MMFINAIADHPDLVAELSEWRHHLHRNPELMYDLPLTAGFVEEKLRNFGFDEIVRDLAPSGVVGVLHGCKGQATCKDKSILLRADMDALPLLEKTNAPHCSQLNGKMHACGHDGHTVMLLGAAKLLAEKRDFDGTVIFCFQPAEEGGAGAKAMIDAGLLERYPVKSAFGLHNWPGMPIGSFGITPRAMMAGADALFITIEGKAAHAAQPHRGRDPITAAAYLITLLQTIVSRKLDPLTPAVISITSINGGEAWNIIPDTVEMRCNIRTFSDAVAEAIHREINSICLQVANSFDLRIEALRPEGCIPYPPTINHPIETAIAIKAAQMVSARTHVTVDHEPTMAAEDFGFILREVPGAFMFIGNGDSAPLHNAEYDFNDESIPFGVSYWLEVVRYSLGSQISVVCDAN
ncbi:amidohydrolase [Ochrobactrum sp. Marseille-Q0166]|uniref:amidohydrolase n=1 Tax=Ochrobactrum sp. Marseille-Q0166 TaxID=2761105 RepID=UPI001656637D|nr:amidohydrolase [Ochrobactrum sp. Marseille-Q0166]MBC8719652.1 amidohydrolase [Ochrobactrum sp. Marseille-Q0166]